MKAPQMIFSLLSIFALLPMGITGPYSARDSTGARRHFTAGAFAQLPPVPIEFTMPTPPSRGRPGGRREGGANRGSCHIAGQLPLTALVPSFDTGSLVDMETETELSRASATDKEATEIRAANDIFSLTTQARPSFWFYVPYSLETTVLEFVLLDEDNNTLYRNLLSKETSNENSTNVFESNNHGIIQITLPDSAPALQPDTTYHWFFLAYCQHTPNFVEGRIARQSPLSTDSAEALMVASPREQAMFYAQNGLWQETLTLLGERYRENATDLEILRDWQSLLKSVNLEHLSEQPLLDCCEME
ncbi:conserved domain protein [Synechococcus sp. PCC 7335]|uniref:DUF928 domain-containing protein n=1 Tax=Synechococcus sp. (strain ATCC 29403 / PCC 7335) TaxID=91464 RepID=UPI00017EC34C|nr:DUF928 domain-containing protein [Synechococcus sp. PCC 7335]EDX85668.1 conserved domain protein [Synechococcus sp. PCC 7335]